jgi:hypothetical protein
MVPIQARERPHSFPHTVCPPRLPISPPEEALRSAVQSLRSQHPTLGVAKLHALLLSENSGWTVSEKRLRRIMTAEGLTLQPPIPAKGRYPSGAHIYPSSTLIEDLDVAKWTAAVEIKYFDKQRGKGLIAKEDNFGGSGRLEGGPVHHCP